MVPGTLHFDPRCALCVLLAGLAGLLDWRGAIGLRAMSEEEYRDVGAPFFRGTEGVMIVGVGPVVRRWVKEVLHPRPSFPAPVEA